ncbi:MAG: response regulator receiver protein [Hyphomicrobiales bacterium]|jgi:DNA-binding NtrC family response regulator|nr:response regulator receiver protein [Hyphomicrobiales bacterium]
MKPNSAIHVLLVDHDEAVADLLKRDLSDRGCQVEVFPDYRGALALIESDRPLSIMITCIQLPPGTPHGVSLANMAVQKRPDLPVIFIAGDVASAQFIDERWGPVIFKPIDPDHLMNAIKATIKS